MIWFCADHHFGDIRVNDWLRNVSSIEENIEKLIKNHNAVVAPTDIVYFLGDVCRKTVTDETYCDAIASMNGIKHLVMGNHDQMPLDVYKKLFYEVYPKYFILENEYYLTHYPSDASNDMMTLCGHVHGSWRVQRNMINVGVDVWGLSPVSLKTIRKYHDLILNEYDKNIFAGELSQNRKLVGWRDKVI